MESCDQCGKEFPVTVHSYEECFLRCDECTEILDEHQEDRSNKAIEEMQRKFKERIALVMQDHKKAVENRNVI